MKNRTANDAVKRVHAARTGSLQDASDEYLEALQRELDRWAQAVTRARWALEQQARAAAEPKQ